MKNLLLSIMLALFPLAGFAQTYAGLWKEVAAYQQKDLPKSALQSVDKIVAQALRRGDGGQLVKAVMVRHQLAGDISPDSAKMLIPRLESYLAKEEKAEMQAIYHSVLGRLYACENPWRNEEAAKQAVMHYTRSLDHAALLATVKAAKYVPLVEVGEDSRYYRHDLLHVVMNNMFDLNRMHDASEGIDTVHMKAYHKAIGVYRSLGNRDGELLMMLDSAETARVFYRESLSQTLGKDCFTDQARTQFYESLLARDGDLETAVEIYCKLAGIQPVENIYRWANEGIRRFPKSKRTNFLRDRLEQIVQPQVSLILPNHVAYPGETDSAEVTGRHVSGGVLKFYRLPYKVNDKELETLFDNEAKLKPFLKNAVAEYPFTLPKGAPYETVKSKLKVEMPREAGLYCAVLEPSPGEKHHFPNGERTILMHVTRLYIMQLALPNGQTRVFVCDSKTGHPVAGVQVQLRSRDKKRPAVSNYTTDANGAALVPSMEWGYEVYVKTEADAYCPAEMLSRSYERRVSEPTRSRVLRLYTDRAIYRPGQQVQVGGIIYEKRGDEVKALANQSVKLRFLDANHKELASETVVSDEYGTLKSQLKLPESCLNGIFFIESQWGTAHYRVEQYKRPTFKVTLEDVKTAYQAGDTVRMAGTVKTFAGFALPSTRVALEVTRRYSPWCFYGNGRTRQLLQDTVLTDAEGRFTVPVFLDIAETDVHPRIARFYTYQVVAVAIAENGESESATANLYAGNRAVSLSTTLPDRLCKELLDSCQLIQRNAAGMPVEGLAQYDVLRAGSVVASGTLPFNKTIACDWLKTLPSGDYLLRVKSADYPDSLLWSEQKFAVFSLDDNHPVGDEPLQVFQTASEFGTDPVRVLVATPLKDVCLHYDLFANGKLLESQVIELSDSAFTIPYTYASHYGDGLYALFAFVKAGQCHVRSLTITRPVPDKALELRWSTFRDRLTAGQDETWTLQVLKDGKPAEASVMATLYDASLDKFVRHDWPFSLYFGRQVPSYFWANSSISPIDFRLWGERKSYKQEDWVFSHFDHSLFNTFGNYRRVLHEAKVMVGAQKAMPMAMNSAVTMAAKVAPDKAETSDTFSARGVDEEAVAEDSGTTEDASAEVRSHFDETAFFMPQLTTNSKGEVIMSFKLPQSLTQWNFRALAHTKGVDYGTLSASVVASKDFMVQPNMPRFLRVGDHTALAASVRNATGRSLSGKALMELIDPATQKTISRQQSKFEVQPNGETTVTFPVSVTDGYPLLVCRISATSGKFSDGEQHYIPILDDKQEVTESVPLSLVGTGIKTTDISSLFNGDASHTSHNRLTVEYTGNPAWLAVEALPSMARPVNESAYSMAMAYYALSLAEMEAHADPAIEQLAKAWRDAGGVDSVFLLLERNSDLKQIVLNETPWVAAADGERERLLQLGNLFDPLTMSYRRHSYLDKLLSLQNADGSWSWFPSMPGSLWMTVDVCELMAKLGHLSPEAIGGPLQQRLERAFGYMEREVAKIVAEYKKTKKQTGHDPHVGDLILRYLHSCALRGVSPNADRTYLIRLLEESAVHYDMYAKAQAAVVLAAAGKRKASELTLQSLMEHTVCTPEMGRYFDTDRSRWAWHSYKVPTQVAALDAISQLAPQDTLTIQEMTRWLLQAKRTQTWDNPRSSVDAVYYLFLRQNMLAHSGGRSFPRITLTYANRIRQDLTANAHQIQMPATLGYYRQTLTPAQLKGQPSTLTVEKTAGPMAFGAVYAQYLVPVAEAKAMAAGLSLRAAYSVRRGQRWEALTDRTVLAKGDLLRIRYELTADRDYDFVHLKEGRPACCEPVQPLSGYDWQSGAYRQVGDASTNYYFEQLAKGTHVFETQMRVDRAGTFRSAVPTVQCVYSPEFFGRGEAVRLNVAK